MQRKSRLVSTLCALACAASLAPAAQAAELGEASVRSYIGQQLAADIELVSLTPDELHGLQVRLAPVDVYQGASITMNPALATVHLSVVRRDQRQFLHLTTLKAIEANYVHLFLELGVAGRTDVRAATLWLQPDPHPAPPPAPVVAAAPSAGAAVAELEAAAETALRTARPRAARPAAAAGPAPAAARPPRTASAAEAVEATDSGAATGTHGDASASSNARHRSPAVPPAIHGRSEAACASQAARVSAKECVVLDRRSTALTEKLVALEEKVKVLQTALDGKSAPDGKSGGDTKSMSDSKSASDSQLASDTKPLRAHVPPRAGASRPASTKLKYKKEAPVETGPDVTTLAAAGGAVLLALAGGGYYWLRRRKQGGQARGPLKIWQGWRRKKAEEAVPEDAQPEKDALDQA